MADTIKSPTAESSVTVGNLTFRRIGKIVFVTLASIASYTPGSATQIASIPAGYRTNQTESFVIAAISGNSITGTARISFTGPTLGTPNEVYMRSSVSGNQEYFGTFSYVTADP